ncbi:hypothetical protein LMH87_002121 [Akanthomyces muscarius]|uniref:AB hydrolase-1 domain-containing protein n=1 Tax=Akanthomyces muscarius TaxID=2231603 RepID=A0A9W8UJ31_AKAMU|nr:hypothetical protein LMH87_002121 [Akanthomyces muscarius]KAJ4147609.1 hypothetical protein LMH87_002121 [Akanthomyces muscarius]
MDQVFRLTDGRQLSYSVSAATDGIPLIFLHGTPGNKAVLPVFEAKCKSRGVKLITIDRAGYGGSTRQKGRRVADVVDDIKQLTQHLSISKCLVAGWSGGGPHALACAARLPGCLAALLIASVGPSDADDLDFLSGQGEGNLQEFHAALQGEAKLREFCEAERPDMMGDAQSIMTAMASNLPEVDKAVILRDPDFGNYLSQSFREGLQVNCDGWIDDDLAFLQPWGFDVGENKTHVLLYQGSDDKMVPFAHGKWIAQHLPAGTAQLPLSPQ